MKLNDTQVRVSLASIRKTFAAYIDSDEYAPKVLRGWDGHDTVIIWEDGAPYDWTILVNGGYDEFGTTYAPCTMPPGVHAEAVNGCVLALYRDK